MNEPGLIYSPLKKDLVDSINIQLIILNNKAFILLLCGVTAQYSRQQKIKQNGIQQFRRMFTRP
jgi:hypothetical protein